MRPPPLRFDEAKLFLESARDMGDIAMIECAIRVWNWTCFPRTQHCTEADRAMFREWKECP